MHTITEIMCRCLELLSLLPASCSASSSPPPTTTLRSLLRLCLCLAVFHGVKFPPCGLDPGPAVLPLHTRVFFFFFTLGATKKYFSEILDLECTKVIPRFIAYTYHGVGGIWKSFPDCMHTPGRLNPYPTERGKRHPRPCKVSRVWFRTTPPGGCDSGCRATIVSSSPFVKAIACLMVAGV